MPVFPSAEWMDEFCARLAAQPRADGVAQALDGVYRFVIEPGGPLVDRHQYDLAISPDGRGLATRLDQPVPLPRLTLAATYPRWRELIIGELDVGRALLFRRLRVSGDLAVLRSRLDTTTPLACALGEVDSTWLEA